MLTEKHKSTIAVRLGPLINSSMSGGFYYNIEKQQFVKIESFRYFIWHTSYYAGHGFQMGLATYLISSIFVDPEIPEEVPTNVNLRQTYKHELLFLVAGLIIWLAVSMILAVESLAIQYRQEMAQTMNCIYEIDAQLKRMFPIYCKRVNTRFETYVTLTCYAPLVLPLIFAISLFHPSDPVHNLIVSLFEIEVSPKSPFIWVFLLLEMWTVAALANIIASHCLLWLAINLCYEYWIEAATCVNHATTYFKHKNLTGFLETKHLGLVSTETLIWLYRCFQLMTRSYNVVVGTIRFAYHSAGLLIMAIVASFALIKAGDALLESVMSFSLAMLLVVAFVWANILIFMECYLVDGMDAKWKEYKYQLLCLSGRNTELHKSAKSFMPVTLQGTHPFCKTNKSMFLEWCDVGVNNLVIMLVSFIF